MLTRLSTFFGFSSWLSLGEPVRMEEALCGVGGGPRLEEEPVDELEGDFLIGEPVLEEEEEEPGGGGKSSTELSGGGGGNSGDCGAPPGCHFGLDLTAGGDWGALNLEPSMELEAGREQGAAFPGNWFTICLTKDEVAAAMEVEEEEGDRARLLEERLCCFGSVGGGWFGECPVEKLCCFFIGALLPNSSTGDMGDMVTGREDGPEGLGAV